MTQYREKDFREHPGPFTKEKVAELLDEIQAQRVDNYTLKKANYAILLQFQNFLDFVEASDPIDFIAKITDAQAFTAARAFIAKTTEGL